MRVPQFRTARNVRRDSHAEKENAFLAACNKSDLSSAMLIIFYGIRSFKQKYWILRISFNWPVNGDEENFRDYINPVLRANKSIGKFSGRTTTSLNGIIFRVSGNWYTLWVCGLAWQLYMMHKMCLHNRCGQGCDSLVIR